MQTPSFAGVGNVSGEGDSVVRGNTEDGPRSRPDEEETLVILDGDDIPDRQANVASPKSRKGDVSSRHEDRPESEEQPMSSKNDHLS